jgi:excinuclease UvrABC helicase subunit UvrB
MGYLKRKRTKRRGKKGTKKYRGGMNGAVNPVVMSSNALDKTEKTSEPPPGNAEKEAAKEEVKKQIEDLKSALDKVELDVELDKLNTMRDAMTTFMTALST